VVAVQRGARRIRRVPAPAGEARPNFSPVSGTAHFSVTKLSVRVKMFFQTLLREPDGADIFGLSKLTPREHEVLA
jgi:hypothetical protein